MKKLMAYITLTRPLNVVIGFVSILVGGAVSGSVHPFGKLLLAGISAALIAAGANAINDCFDVEIDKINKPNRPLPAGLLGLPEARFFAFLLFIAGCMISPLVNGAAAAVAVGTSILLFAYSAKLKGTVLWGNLTVAFVSGLAFVYGGMAVGRIKQSVAAGVFSSLFHLGREIIKDGEDVAGDRAKGIVTLPIRYGIRRAVVCSTIILSLLIFLTPIPFWMGMFSKAYLVTVIAGVDAFLVVLIISMWRNPEPEHLGRLARWMKYDMPVGLLAVFLGSYL